MARAAGKVVRSAQASTALVSRADVLVAPPPVTDPWSAVIGGEPRIRRLQIHYITVMLTVVGLFLTGLLTSLSLNARNNDNQKLLDLQARQVATALRVAVPTLQSQLISAYETLQSGGAPAADFRAFMAQEVRSTQAKGTPKAPFSSASLYQGGPGGPKLLALVGPKPAILAHPAQFAGLVAELRPSATMYVTGIIEGRSRHLGYAEEPPGDTSDYFIYAEAQLPNSNHIVIPKSTGYEDLNFALYLGDSIRSSKLIESTMPLPFHGAMAEATVPFGNSFITLVATPDANYTPGGSQQLPLFIVVAGIVFTAMLALIYESLGRRKDLAVRVADYNAEMLGHQRGISEALQRAMLPPELPRFNRAEIAVAYLPGVGDLEIGGDWYDVIRMGPDDCFVVVGDVSGRGLLAARTMAALRYAIRAYVAQGDEPSEIIDKLGELVNVGQDRQFATVMIGHFDLGAGVITLADAGHLPALMSSARGTEFLDVAVGPPIGVGGTIRPGARVIELPEEGKIVIFTDGLVERRGETIDEGLERLRQVAETHAGGIRDLVIHMVDQLAPGGANDDIAILGVQWRK